MALSWDEVSESDGYKALSPGERASAATQYFDEVVAPQVDPSKKSDVFAEFSKYTGLDFGADVAAPPTIDMDKPTELSTAQELAISPVGDAAMAAMQGVADIPKTLARGYDYLNELNPFMNDSARERYSAEKLVDRFNVGEGLPAIGRAIAEAPEQVVSSALAAYRAGDIQKEKRWYDESIDAAKESSEAFIKEHGSEKEIAPGITMEDVATLPRNLGFSISNMLVGLGVGVPAGFVGGPVAGYVAGGMASGVTAYRMAKDQITSDLFDILNSKSVESRGSELTDAEWSSFKESYDSELSKYGLWEAVPEALSNVGMFKIIRVPLGKFMTLPAVESILARGAVKYAGIQATEHATETITGYGQGGIEADIGLREKAPTIMEAFKEQAPQTALLTTVMGAGAAGISKTYDVLKRSEEKTAAHVENITNAESIDDAIQAANEAVSQDDELLNQLNEMAGVPEATDGAVDEVGDIGLDKAPVSGESDKQKGIDATGILRDTDELAAAKPGTEDTRRIAEERDDGQDITIPRAEAKPGDVTRPLKNADEATLDKFIELGNKTAIKEKGIREDEAKEEQPELTLEVKKEQVKADVPIAKIDFKGQTKIVSGDVFSKKQKQPPTNAREKADELIDSGEFDNLPQVSVPIDKIIPTQRFISEANLEKIKDVSTDTNSTILKYGDDYYVLDGHHRIVKNIENNETHITAHVFEYKDERLTPKSKREAEKQVEKTSDVVNNGSTETEGGVKRGTSENVQMQKEEQAKAEVLQGMPREVYERLAQIEQDDTRSDEKGQLQELRRRVSEEGKDTKEAMREMWGEELRDAPRRLREAFRGYVDVQEMPSGTPQEKQLVTEEKPKAEPSKPIEELNAEYKRLADIRHRIRTKEITTKEGLKEAGVKRKIDLERAIDTAKEAITAAKAAPASVEDAVTDTNAKTAEALAKVADKIDDAVSRLEKVGEKKAAPASPEKPAEKETVETKEVTASLEKPEQVDIPESTPITIHYAHNLEKSPDVGNKFGQDIEPAGRYLVDIEKGKAPEGWEEGNITFDNPLHIDFGGSYREESNWKNVLSDKYDGKKGNALSKAIVEDGYDGIITHDKYGTSEIVDLSVFKKSEPEAKQTYKDTTLYSKGVAGALSRTDADAELRKDKRLSKLMDAGKLIVVLTTEGLPDGVNRDRTSGTYKNGVVYIVANRNTTDTISGVAWHEVTHAAMDQAGSAKEFLGKKQHAQLMKRLSTMYKMAEKGSGSVNKFFQQAYDRIPAATPTDAQVSELAGYTVERYENEPKSVPQSIVKWVKDFIAAVKAAIFRRTGALLGKLQPQDLLAIAKAYASFEARKAAGGRKPAPAGQFQPVPTMASERAATFYSQLQRVLAQKLPGKGAPKQLALQIQAMARKGDFKKEELEWSGVVEWLNEQSAVDGKATKDQVIDFLKANEIRVEEVTKGEGYQDPFKTFDEAFEYLSDEGDKTKEEVMFEYDFTEDTPESEYIDHANAMGASEGELRGDTKHATHVLPGGENYRELVLTVPSIEPFAKSDTTHFGDVGGGRAVAWIRFNERTDADGKRVLFIEEIQSKRHQEGRKKGYSTTLPKVVFMEDIQKYTLEFSDGSKMGEYDQEHRAENARSTYKDIGIPDAPFKTTWHLLAMKRMIRHAAENGFNSIAWTTGEMQAERYDLSKKLSSITVRKVRPNSTHWTLDAYDMGGDNVISESINELSELDAYIGKDAADKARKQIDGYGHSFIDSDGLKVGGEGMAAFYDKMLPSAVNKYVKKWGGKVGETTIKTEDPALDSKGEVLETYEEKFHSLDITPKMRDAAMQGQPLFSKKETESLAELNNKLAKDNGEEWRNAYELDDQLNTHQTLLKEVFDKTFGVSLQYIRATDIAYEGIGGLEYKGILYVNSRGENGFVQLAGHELLHSIKRGSPAIYSWLESESKSSGVFAEAYQRRLADNGITETLEASHEELLADALGDALADPEFLKALAADNPGKFKMLMRTILNWLKDTASKLSKAGLGSSEYIRDVNDLRGYLMGALDAFSKEGNPDSIDSVEQVKYSRGRKTPFSKAVQTELLPDDAMPPAETKARALQRTWQDKMNRFAVIRDWLSEHGTKLTEAADVWMHEGNMHGRIAARSEDFREKVVKVLTEKTQAAKFEMSDIQDFLKMRHVPEANARMQQIHHDPDATASGITTEDANAVIAEFEKMDNFEEFKAIADEWRNITETTKQILIDSGIITKEMAEAWEKTYKFYVPLKGAEDESATGTGKGLSVAGKQKRRMGHGEREEAIIQHIIRDHERAIALSEKNHVGVAVLNMAVEASNPNLITVERPVKRQVYKDSKLFTVNYEGIEVGAFDSKQKANDFINQDAALSKRNLIKYNVQESFDPTVAMMASPMLADNEAHVYVNGHAVRVQFNDPILARAYTNMGVEHLGVLLAGARTFNAWLSKAYTGYNPEFAGVNFLRDLFAGSINLTGDYGFGMTRKIYANYPLAIKELIKSFADPSSSEIIKAYRAAGGNTGASYLPDIERIGADVMNSYNEYAGAINTYNRVFKEETGKGRSKSFARLKAVTKAGRAKFSSIPLIGHFLSMMMKINSVTENALRVATYHTLVENGFSKAKAAQAAKMSTVNFNRKGEWGAQAGALFLFFNPNVQGTERIISVLGSSKHKGQARAMAGMMVFAAFTIAELMRAQDEDDWENTESWMKDRNMVLNTGERKILIPVPYGYGIFHTLGNTISDVVHGMNGWEAGLRLTESMFENFSPVGNPIPEGELKPFQLLPTALKMAIAPELNENNFGRPIQPMKYDSLKPDSSNMYRSSKGSLYESVAKGMNSLTGGNEYTSGGVDISPQTVKFWVTSLTGGAGKFIADTVSLASVTAQGVMPELREIPVLRKFVRESGIQDVRGRFWKAAREAKLAAAEFNAAIKHNDISRAKEIQAEDPALIALAKYARQQQVVIKARRDAIDDVRASGISLAEKRIKMKEMELVERKLYEQFLKIFKLKTKG